MSTPPPLSPDPNPPPPVDLSTLAPTKLCAYCAHPVQDHVPELSGCFHVLSLSFYPVFDCGCEQFE